jgi:hypothetical protein
MKSGGCILAKLGADLNFPRAVRYNNVLPLSSSPLRERGRRRREHF